MSLKISIGGIHKPCGHGGGGGLAKTPYYYIRLTYLVFRIVHEGDQKCLKNCPHGLWMTPCLNHTDTMYVNLTF